MTFFNENFTRADAKARLYILLILKFPPCLRGNLKSIRYKHALASALVKFPLKKSYFHFFISSKFCKTPNHQLVSFSFNDIKVILFVYTVPLKTLKHFPKSF